MIRIKIYVPSRNFLSVFRKFLKQRFSRNNYRHCYHEFIKRFNIEGAEVFWEITVLARFAKLQGKTSIAQPSLSKVVWKKPEASVNMELFLNIFLGVKENNCYKLLLVLVNMWIRTITVTADIKQIITEVSVIFITKISVPQLHIYFCNISTQSIWSVKISSSCFFSLGSFMCNGTLTFAY